MSNTSVANSAPSEFKESFATNFTHFSKKINATDFMGQYSKTAEEPILCTGVPTEAKLQF